MPWNETSTMDQKRLFIKDYLRASEVRLRRALDPHPDPLPEGEGETGAPTSHRDLHLKPVEGPYRLRPVGDSGVPHTSPRYPFPPQ